MDDFIGFVNGVNDEEERRSANGLHVDIYPRTITEANIANFRRQLKMLGFSYDWSRQKCVKDKII